MWTEVPPDWDAGLDALDSALRHPENRWEAACLDTLTLLREIKGWTESGRGTRDHRSKQDWKTFRDEIAIVQDGRSYGPELGTIINPTLERLRASLEHGPDGITAGAIAHEIIAQLSENRALLAAWSDLTEAAHSLRNDVERFRRYRNEFLSIAGANQCHLGTFGKSDTVRGVLADQRDYIVPALRLTGREPQDLFGQPRLYGMPKNERLGLCRDLWAEQRLSERNIVWLTYDEAVLPRGKVRLSRVSFYSGAYLASLTEAWTQGHATGSELPEELKRTELGVVDWAPEPEFGVTYVRVDLGSGRVTTAVDDAIELTAAVLDIFGSRFDRAGWNLRSHVRQYSDNFNSDSDHCRSNRAKGFWQTDLTGMFLEDAESNPLPAFQINDELRRILDAQSKLRGAEQESPTRVTTASVELLETVKTVAIGAELEWWELAEALLKSPWVLQRTVNSLIDAALYIGSREHRRWVKDEHLDAFRKITQSFTNADVAGHVTVQVNNICDSCLKLLPVLDPDSLVRAELQEACKVLSPSNAGRRIKRFESEFSILLGRVRRCRNAAAHGWPIENTVAESAARFARQLTRVALRPYILATTTAINSPSFEMAAQRAQADGLIQEIKERGYTPK